MRDIGKAEFVMAGLVPAIHVLLWMPGTRPGMTNAID